MIIAHLEELAEKHNKPFEEVVELARDICDDLLDGFDVRDLYKSNRRNLNE